MDRIFHVYTSNGPDRYEELKLPASDHQLLDLMERLRLEPGRIPYLEILNCREEYNCLEQCIQELPDIFQLNALAKKLSELSRVEDMRRRFGSTMKNQKSGLPSAMFSQKIWRNTGNQKLPHPSRRSLKWGV